MHCIRGKQIKIGETKAYGMKELSNSKKGTVQRGKKGT